MEIGEGMLVGDVCRDARVGRCSDGYVLYVLIVGGTPRNRFSMLGNVGRAIVCDTRHF